MIAQHTAQLKERWLRWAIQGYPGALMAAVAVGVVATMMWVGWRLGRGRSG